jgi:hypothetical protein
MLIFESRSSLSTTDSFMIRPTTRTMDLSKGRVRPGLIGVSEARGVSREGNSHDVIFMTVPMVK